MAQVNHRAILRNIYYITSWNHLINLYIIAMWDDATQEIEDIEEIYEMRFGEKIIPNNLNITFE